MNPKCAYVIVAAHLMLPLSLFCQTAALPPLPSDPVALMSLAREKNGLNAPDLKPWHIRGSYTTYDVEGKESGTGVYEEWWVSPTKYKVSYTSAHFTQVDYANGDTLYRSGSQKWPGAYEGRMRLDLIEPLLDDDALKEFKPELHVIANGAAKLTCVKLAYSLSANMIKEDSEFVQSCFESAIPALRDRSQFGFETTYNRIGVFQGHYVAREMLTNHQGKPWTKLNLEIVEGLKEPVETLLAPPPDAVPVDVTAMLVRDVRELERIKSSAPKYPEGAKANGTEGKVVMQVTIGTDGRIKSVQVISGPSVFEKAAVDAVHGWMYRPFRLMGVRREVSTEVTVAFHFGG
jgi:TonB family protein